MSQSLEPLHSARQAASILGISERGLRRLVAARRISFIRIGGRLLFRDYDLKAVIDAASVPALRR